MEYNGKDVVARFQQMTGIQNVEEAVTRLEDAGWESLDAKEKNFLLWVEDFGIGKGTAASCSGSPGEAGPSTSQPPRFLHIHIHRLGTVYKLKVPDSITYGALKAFIQNETGIKHCYQTLTGWPPSSEPASYSVKLQTLNLPTPVILQLTISSNLDKVDDKWFLDGVLPLPRDGSESEGEVAKDVKVKSEGASRSSESQQNSPCAATRRERNAKRFKKDPYFVNFKIIDEFNRKEYEITFPRCRTVGRVFQEVFGLTNIPLKDQVWYGWPCNATDETQLSELSLDEPFHFLVLQSSTHLPRPAPQIINVAGSSEDSTGDPTDGGPHEDSAEGGCCVHSNLFKDRASAKALMPLIPSNVEDETAGSEYFRESYTRRYGPIKSPSFYPGTLEEALKEACFKPARERRMLALYLHHDGSVRTNVFCTELLGYETVLQTLANYFVVWGWDITNRGIRQMFFNSVTRLLGSTVAETVQSISTDLLPAIMIISRTRSNLQLFNVIHGNIGINEFVTMLIHAADVFTDMQETEVKEEEERSARERIMMEQDRAYQESLQIDRAKEEAKKQQMLLQSQEKERLLREQKLEEEKRQAEKLAAESQLPEEPSSDTPSSALLTFRFRPPTGESFMRKFLSSDLLKTVFNFLLVKGFSTHEYKYVSPWPTRKDLSTLDEKASLKELGLCFQETIILEER